MGTDASSRPTRRTVLKATGTALGTGLVAAGTAAASDFESGDCAMTKYESMTYNAACPTGDHTGYIDGDVMGQVLNTCTASDGEDWAYFSPGETIDPAYWVRESNLEHC